MPTPRRLDDAGGAAAAAAARSSGSIGRGKTNDDDDAKNGHEGGAASGSPVGPDQGNYLPGGSTDVPNAESRCGSFRRHRTTIAGWTNDGEGHPVEGGGLDVEEWGGAVGDTWDVAVNSWDELAHGQYGWPGMGLPEVNNVLLNIHEHPEDMFRTPRAIPAELHSSPLVLAYMKAVSRLYLYGGKKKESFKENVVIPLNAALEAVVAEFRRGVPCAACGNVGISTQRICGGCGQIRYCSEECCLKHFSAHEKECGGVHINGKSAVDNERIVRQLYPTENTTSASQRSVLTTFSYQIPRAKRVSTSVDTSKPDCSCSICNDDRNRKEYKQSQHRFVRCMASYFGVMNPLDGFDPSSLEREFAKARDLEKLAREGANAGAVDSFLEKVIKQLTCDTDHLVGRSEEIYNSLYATFPCSHSMNCALAWIRFIVGDWCYGLSELTYTGGNA